MYVVTDLNQPEYVCPQLRPVAGTANRCRLRDHYNFGKRTWYVSIAGSNGSKTVIKD